MKTKIKPTAARKIAFPAAVFLCVYYFFIFNHAFKLLPYVALAFFVSFVFYWYILFLGVDSMNSFWTTDINKPHFKSLNGDTKTDILIVGGGRYIVRFSTRKTK